MSQNNVIKIMGGTNSVFGIVDGDGEIIATTSISTLVRIVFEKLVPAAVGTEASRSLVLRV